MDPYGRAHPGRRPKRRRLDVEALFVRALVIGAKAIVEWAPVVAFAAALTVPAPDHRAGWAVIALVGTVAAWGFAWDVCGSMPPPLRIFAWLYRRGTSALERSVWKDEES